VRCGCGHSLDSHSKACVTCRLAGKQCRSYAPPCENVLGSGLKCGKRAMRKLGDRNVCGACARYAAQERKV
jgi:hypothetical protein